jgi:hypothetical protein
MTDVDLAGKDLRPAGTTGRGRRAKSARQADSRANQQEYWAARFAAAETPLRALRVALDYATTAAVNKERRAAAALKSARKGTDEAAIRQQELRLASVRAELDREVTGFIESLVAFAERHETIRV